MSKCIDWHGYKDRHGYGMFFEHGRVIRAHRKVYADSKGLDLGEISGLVIRHTCDNPSCVNPDHLVPGTQKDNMADKVSRGRQAKGSRHGIAKLTESQVLEIKRSYKPGVRGCGTYSLADKYGVNQSTVYRVVSGELWNHV